MSFRSLVKLFIPKKLFRAIEPWGHLGEAVIFNVIYGFPARRLKVIGVTGTNGKTSTCFLIHRMLHEAGYKVGLMTTVAYGAGEDIRPQGSHMTNVPVPQLMRRLKFMRSRGVEWLVLESTSLALAQNRLWGVPFQLAVMTNISQDHLDYHGTMERYIEAKVRLFELVNRNEKGFKTGVVNADDAQAGKFAAAVDEPLTYGIKKGDLRAKDIKMSAAGSHFGVALPGGGELKLKTSLPGQFNIYNCLAAAGAGLALGLAPHQIEQGIAATSAVEGRMTAVKAGQGFNVLVDFAHTPDALENVLGACKQLTKGKVMVVFGATGDRDKSKRPIMGEVAVKNADKIFLTDDETYTENPKTIIDAVYKGIETAGGASKTTVVDDRLEAIKAAFAAAKTGDTVLLAGIGHLTSRNMGGREIPWDEVEIARKLLKAR